MLPLKIQPKLRSRRERGCQSLSYLSGHVIRSIDQTREQLLRDGEPQSEVRTGQSERCQELLDEDPSRVSWSSAFGNHAVGADDSGSRMPPRPARVH